MKIFSKYYFKYILHVVVFLVSFSPSHGQYLIYGTDTTVYENDSVLIRLKDYRGNVQWEASRDLKNWSVIPVQKNLHIHVDSSAFYRVSVTDGTCLPLYSDTIIIAQLLDKRDGKMYDIIEIGSRKWFAQNLNYQVEEGCWNYNDSKQNARIHGKLYSWETALNVCPDGWHLPTDKEWKDLEIQLGITPDEADNVLWRGGIIEAGYRLLNDKDLGFDATLSGFRDADNNYVYIDGDAAFWTATGYNSEKAWYRGLTAEKNGINRDRFDKGMGFSVRCIDNFSPEVSTISVLDTGLYNVTVEGVVDFNGGEQVHSIGVCWATHDEPTRNDDVSEELFAGDNFLIEIVDLEPGTEYFCRAFAISSKGTGYGNVIKFQTLELIPPEINIDSINGLTDSSVYAFASIVSTGNPEILEAGFCWSKNSIPLIGDNHVILDTVSGSFDGLISGLRDNTNYHIRAFLKNDYEVFYSNSLSVETFMKLPEVVTNSVDNITSGSVTCFSTIIGEEPLPGIERGACWDTSSNPAIDDFFAISDSGTMNYTVIADSLIPNSEYYIRAYIKSSNGLSYGNVIKFKTLPLYSTGTITDQRDGQVYKTIMIGQQNWLAENLNYELTGSWYYDNDSVQHAAANGKLYNFEAANNACPENWHLPNDYEWKVLEKYLGMLKNEADSVLWRGEETAISSELQTTGKTGFDATMAGFRDEEGAYFNISEDAAFWTSSSYDNLKAWYRGLTISKKGINRYYFDKDMGFSVRCVENSLPLVETGNILLTGADYIVCEGSILSEGVSDIIQAGLCWDTQSNPTISNNFSSDTLIGMSFEGKASGLFPNTRYYIRAYAVNSKGISYGEEVEITSLDKSLPLVITHKPVVISKNLVEIEGNVLGDGNDEVYNRGICWDTEENPTIFNSTYASGMGKGAFTCTLSSLEPNTWYYVKAYAINNEGVAYGEQYHFITSLEYPKDTYLDPRDGQEYDIIQVNNSWWFADNLNFHTDTASWYYNNDSSTYDNRGRLYNYNAAVSVCPPGWHLPSDSEWKILEMELGMKSSAVESMNWRGTNQGWQLKTEGTSGFDAMLSGFRDSEGNFVYLNVDAAFWTATEFDENTVWYRGLTESKEQVNRDHFNRSLGFSVRCIKD